MFGTAASATQIEGGDTNHTWYRWCGEPGRISDGSSCIRACDHWNRLEEDTKILAGLQVQTYRMSVEWSRIQPKAGFFSAEAIEHYREEIILLQNHGIRPLVTLHHFSEPLWFMDSGGWINPNNQELFLEYIRHVVENLGDLVSDWVTFNEPNVYTIFGYALGIFPPGERDLKKTLRVASAVIASHCRAYQLIHSIRRERRFKGETRVGTAMHIRIFDGLTAAGKATACFVDYIFHRLFLAGFYGGRFLFPLKAEDKIRPGIYMDYMGLNYYTRNIVEFVLDPKVYFYRFMNDTHLSRSDLGWDIYPKGIYRACKKYYRKYRLPIYITENGISDRFDNRRPDFIKDHLAYVKKAIDEGIPVERYYHWSQMDNFEWNEGENGNFGLYHCDFDTQIRTPRGSAVLYSDICGKKEFPYERNRFIDKKWGYNSFIIKTKGRNKNETRL